MCFMLSFLIRMFIFYMTLQHFLAAKKGMALFANDSIVAIILSFIRRRCHKYYLLPPADYQNLLESDSSVACLVILFSMVSLLIIARGTIFTVEALELFIGR